MLNASWFLSAACCVHLEPPNVTISLSLKIVHVEWIIELQGGRNNCLEFRAAPHANGTSCDFKPSKECCPQVI